MAGGENQIQTRSRASRKRPNQAAEGNPMTKKRVVLGEITNISSSAPGLNQNSSEGKIQKLKPESVLDKPGNEVNHEMAVSPGSDEPQKYGYAPSMLQYLRSQEVFDRFFIVVEFGNKFLDFWVRYSVLER